MPVNPYEMAMEDLLAYIDVNIIDNESEEITPEVLRDVLKALAHSAGVQLADDFDWTQAIKTLPAKGQVAAGATSGTDFLKKLYFGFVRAVATLQDFPLYERGLVNGASVNVKGSFTLNDEADLLNRKLKKAGVDMLIFPDDTLDVNINATETTEFELVATAAGDGGYTLSVNKTAKLVYPTWYGECDSATPTEAQIKAGRKLLADTGSRDNLVFTNNNQRVFLCEPQAYGIRSAILDQNGAPSAGDFTRTAITVTLADGSQVAYYRYVLNGAAGDGSQFKYSFRN